MRIFAGFIGIFFAFAGLASAQERTTTTAFPTGAQRTLCQTPSPACEKMAIEGIASAKRQIVLVVQDIGSEPVAEALLQALKRGVETRILVSKSVGPQTRRQIEEINALKADTIRVAKPGVLRTGLLIIDGLHTAIGGFTFEKNADLTDFQTILVVSNDSEFARLSAEMFLSLFRESSKF